MSKQKYFLVGGTSLPNKPIKYVILGPVKCGTCSLQEYYRVKYPDYEAVRVETIWKDDAFDQWEELLKDHPEAIPVIITRNPTDAMWSYYWYFKQRRKDLSFEDWLKLPLFMDRQGEPGTPAHAYNFDVWIKRWSQYNPLVVSLEEIKNEIDFPIINKTSNKPERKRKHWGWKDNKWPEISPKERQIAEDAIKLESLINNFKQ